MLLVFLSRSCTEPECEYKVESAFDASCLDSWGLNLHSTNVSAIGWTSLSCFGVTTGHVRAVGRLKISYSPVRLCVSLKIKPAVALKAIHFYRLMAMESDLLSYLRVDGLPIAASLLGIQL